MRMREGYVLWFGVSLARFSIAEIGNDSDKVPCGVAMRSFSSCSVCLVRQCKVLDHTSHRMSLESLSVTDAATAEY